MSKRIVSVKATTNLWGERWGKLTQNSMGNGISAPTHAALTEVVKRVELGEIEAHPRNVEKL